MFIIDHENRFFCLFCYLVYFIGNVNQIGTRIFIVLFTAVFIIPRRLCGTELLKEYSLNEMMLCTYVAALCKLYILDCLFQRNTIYQLGHFLFFFLVEALISYAGTKFQSRFFLALINSKDPNLNGADIFVNKSQDRLELITSPLKLYCFTL